MTEISLKTNQDKPTVDHQFEAGDWFFDRTTESLYCLTSRWNRDRELYTWGLINIFEGRLYVFNNATSPLDAFGGDFDDFIHVKKADISIEL